ncbi:DeoR/GlpR transcriptional regulator [Listeria aquatica]|uniref:DeoR/GlpR transcriptional regulator n=2 Tax=Listeria aquatica TaxID=1494960 RepID=A0A841ZQ56_9LIST|nr:DeoR/GlpR family DNA-binding transcription regulator [Listeria aquatica]MBC1521464.1 DeoR/GlpR transcriptional regulator [Listeria aquatica]
MLSVAEERQQQIVNYLKVEQFARIQDLIKLVNYSEATVKRDLVHLENKGLVRRTRGGAMIIDNQKIDIPYLMKMNELNNEENKKYIAEVAKTLIRDDMVIFLDSSSTSLYLVGVLSRFEGLQIITNGVMTASMLSEFTSARVSILGGSILPKRYTVNGAKAYNDALTYNADIAFVSCRGIDYDKGATETHEGEALIKQAYRRQSNLLVLLATQEKMNHKFMHQSLACHDIDYLITDFKLDEETEARFNAHHITCLY